MNTNKKATKRDTYTLIGEILGAAEENGFGLPEGYTFGDLKEFVAHEVELLDKKAESAAKRAADKRTAGDALREKVLGLLTSENQTLAQVTAALGDPNVTPQMVTPRLKQLIDLGQAVKEQVTMAGTDGGKSRKVTVYRIA